jgi:hypothetical protein
MTWPRAPRGAGNKTWFMFWRTDSRVGVPNAFRVMKGN